MRGTNSLCSFSQALKIPLPLDVDSFVEMPAYDESAKDSNKRPLDRLKRRDGELKTLMKRVFEQNALGKIDDAFG